MLAYGAVYCNGLGFVIVGASQCKEAREPAQLYQSHPARSNVQNRKILVQQRKYQSKIIIIVSIIEPWSQSIFKVLPSGKGSETRKASPGLCSSS